MENPAGFYGDQPVPTDHTEFTPTPLTMRDHFAMAALTGYIAMHADARCDNCTPNIAAHAAYLYADAMVAERMKT